MFKGFSFNALFAALGAVALVAVLMFAVGSATNARAATAPDLAGASSYGILAGTTVTNTGATVVDADVGVSPGSAVVGFPPGILTGGGVIHAADAHAAQGQSDVTIAYNNLAGQACDFDYTGQDLGGQTLIEGVYCFSSSAQLTGILTLDAQGNADAVFVFQIGSTLTTASNSLVDVINGGNDCNVFWQVGSSATLGTNTTFVGNILALTSITLNTGADISGRALARNGAVTMDTNNVGFSACTVDRGTASPTAVPTATPVITAVPTDTPPPVPTDSPPPVATPTLSPTPVGQTPPPATPTLSPTPVGQTPPPVTPTPVGPTPSPTPFVETPSPTPFVETPSPTPVGQTPTPTPVAPTPSPTPTTTETPGPSPTGPTSTQEVPQLPPPAPTNTPSPNTPVVPHFPNTGGPPASGGMNSLPLMLGLALSTLGAAAFVMSRRGKRLAEAKASD